MAENLGDALLTLRTDDGPLEQGLREARRKAEQAMNQLAAAQARVTTENQAARAAYKAGEISLEAYNKKLLENKVALSQVEAAHQQAQKSVAQFESSGQRVTASAGQQRQGMQQLSFQLNDVATMYALGARPMQIFASQSGQVIQAVQTMTGGTSRLAAFLGGPWGLALTSAAIVLTPFIGKLFEASDAAREADEASKELAERQTDIALFFNMATGAIREQNAALIQNAILKRDQQADEIRARREDRKQQIRDIVREGSIETFERDPQGGRGSYRRNPGNPALINAARSGDIDGSLRQIATSNSPNAARAAQLLELRALNVSDARELGKVEKEAQSLISGTLDADLRDPVKAPRSPRGGSTRSGGSVRPGRTQEDRDADFARETASLEREELQARLALADTAQDRADIQNELLSLERAQRIAEIEATDLSRAQKDANIAAVEAILGTAAAVDEQGNLILSANRGLQGQIIDREKAAQIRQESAALAEEEFRAEQEALALQLELADTEAERKKIALQLLAAEERHLQVKFREIANAEDAGEAERQRAQRALDALENTSGDRREAVSRANETTLERYLRDLQKTPEQINEAIDKISIDGLESLNDGLVDAITGARSLGEVFSSVADQIIADLLRIAIQQLVIRPLAESLFGGLGGGGGGGFSLGSLFGGGGGDFFGTVFAGGFATGGLLPAGQFGLVGEEGPEIAVSTPAGTRIFSNAQSRTMLGEGGGAGGPAFNISMPVTLNAPGADPAQLARLRAEFERFRQDAPGLIVTTVQDASDRRIISTGGL